MAAIPVINAQLDALKASVDQIGYANTMIAGKLGALQSPADWATYLALVRAGLIGLYTKPGDQIDVDHSSTLTTHVEGTGVTAAAVDRDVFLAAAGMEKHDYEFLFDGHNWHYEGNAVTLNDYGISVTGTAASGDAVTVHRTATTYAWNTLGINEDVPVNRETPNCVSLQMEKVLYTLNFDPPMFLFGVSAAACTHYGWDPAVGMPAGDYAIGMDHASYGGESGEDTTIYFHLSQPVPVGGGIRHSTMGAYSSTSSDYQSPAKVLGGKITTYGADTVTAIETNVPVTDTAITGAVSLGTATARDPQYRSGDYINFTDRQCYGANRLDWSYLFQVLNSDDAELNWKPATIWSRNMSTRPEGFLHSIDPSLRAVLTKVRKRLALPISDGYGYVDLEAYCFPATMMDVFGGANNSIYEGPVDASGNVKRSTPYTYWKERNTNGQRIKYQGSTARYWWLASCYPSYGYNVRIVNTSGSLSHNDAYSALGVVPSLFIG